MGLLKSESVICPIDQKCSQWARKYMGYCICSTRDEFSLALGFISVLSWCVAEVPQIITHYTKKSADGLSVTFLLTWIIGDLFNLFGCILEPATATFECLLKTYGFLTPDFWRETRFANSPFQEYTDLLAKPTSRIIHVVDDNEVHAVM